MMNQVYKTLPDDRPITSICIVEDPEKCPKGYVAVSRTHDQDADADLWKESGFFGKKCTRYLCLSKTEGTAGYVVQSVIIINEKDSPPKGYANSTLTSDSAQKAWRKKQLCFKYVHISNTATAVTDIIVLSRMKKAPEEFSLLGEINGLTLCYKVGKSVIENGLAPNMNTVIPYSLNPGNPGNVNSMSYPSPDYQNVVTRKSPSNNAENGLKCSPNDKVNPLVPKRRAPEPPSSYATISGYSGLEGVPFILNPKWSFSNCDSETYLPRPKTRSEIDCEYSYEFRTERET